MEINFGLIVACALLGALYWWETRTTNAYREECGRLQGAQVSREVLIDVQAQNLARMHDQLVEQQQHLDAHGRRFAELHADHRRELAAVWHEALERIQRPQVEPVPVGSSSTGPRKLHYDEDDEIAGLTPAEVAAAAGLTAEHEKVIAHVDEIATGEGLGPAS